MAQDAVDLGKASCALERVCFLLLLGGVSINVNQG